LETQVQDGFSYAEGRGRNDCLDQRDGDDQSPSSVLNAYGVNALSLGIHVCKRTIQKYMRTVRTHQPRGQKWSTFLRNRAAQVWACDALSGD